MKRGIFISVFCASFVFMSFSVNGQLFDRLKKSVEDKVVEKTDQLINGKEKETNDNDKFSGSSTVYDFVPGSIIIFEDNFTGDKLGSMPEYWKSGGSGSVTTYQNVSGKWLKLNAFTTYKLDTLFAMPTNFTLEFDLLTRSNELKDLEAISFGFSSDNSVNGYNEPIIEETQIHYWNQEIKNSSHDVDSYNTIDYDLKNYDNAIMHVAIQVQGENMKVYLDKNKVLDAKMFKEGRKKYFYISPSTKLNNNAEIAISNFKVAVNGSNATM